jgi:flagellar motor switch protein FliM
MEKVLTQEEVDALLKGLDSGAVDTAPNREPLTGIRSYDLLNQERIIRGRMPTLDIIHDRFIRLQSITWTTFLRRSVDFNVASTQIVKFGEIFNKFPIPSALTIFRADPLRGHGLFVMDATLVYLLVDHLFGGSCQTQVKPEGRDFTLIQQRIIRTVVDLTFADLAKAWQPVVALGIQLVRLESNPQFAMVVSVSEIVVAIKLEVSLRTEQSTRPLYLVYPYSMIEPLKEKLYAGFVSDQLEQDDQWTQRFTTQLLDCAVRLTARLGTATVRVRDVLNFAPGDVLILDQKPGDPVDCFVEGLPKLHGSALVVKSTHAFRVSRILS